MDRVGMDLVTVAASSVGQQSVVSPHGSIIAGRSSGVGAGVITEPIYVDSVGGPADELSASSAGGTPPGLQLTTITVAVPAGPLSPNEHNIDINMPFGKANKSTIFSTWTTVRCTSFQNYFSEP